MKWWIPVLLLLIPSLQMGLMTVAWGAVTAIQNGDSEGLDFGFKDTDMFSWGMMSLLSYGTCLLISMAYFIATGEEGLDKLVTWGWGAVTAVPWLFSVALPLIVRRLCGKDEREAARMELLSRVCLESEMEGLRPWRRERMKRHVRGLWRQGMTPRWVIMTDMLVYLAYFLLRYAAAVRMCMA